MLRSNEKSRAWKSRYNVSREMGTLRKTQMEMPEIITTKTEMKTSIYQLPLG